jgi:hypothetical protein
MKYHRNSDRFGGIHRAVMRLEYNEVRVACKRNPLVVNSKDNVDAISPLYLAAELDDDKMIQLLIEEFGAQVNLGNGLTGKYGMPAGVTALHRAAQLGNIRTFNELLKVKNVKIDPVNIWISSPLAMACREGHLSIAQSLLARGALIEAEKLCNRPLHILLTAIRDRSFLETKHTPNSGIDASHYACFLVLLAYGVRVRPEDVAMVAEIRKERQVDLQFDLLQISFYRKWRRMLALLSRAISNPNLFYLVFENATRSMMSPSMQRRFWNMEKRRDTTLMLDLLANGRKMQKLELELNVDNQRMS